MCLKSFFFELVLGNFWVISQRANRIKTEAAREKFETLVIGIEDHIKYHFHSLMIVNLKRVKVFYLFFLNLVKIIIFGFIGY